MNCSKAIKNMSAYLDTELHDLERGQLEAHLIGCPACFQRLEELRALQTFFQPPLQNKAPADFAASVMGQINGQQSGSWFMKPCLVRFAEVITILLVISLGAVSGGILTKIMMPEEARITMVAGFSPETFESLPADSLARSYLNITEVRP